MVVISIHLKWLYALPALDAWLLSSQALDAIAGDEIDETVDLHRVSFVQRSANELCKMSSRRNLDVRIGIGIGLHFFTLRTSFRRTPKHW